MSQCFIQHCATNLFRRKIFVCKLPLFCRKSPRTQLQKLSVCAQRRVLLARAAQQLAGSSSPAPRRRHLVVGTSSVCAQRRVLLARAAQQLAGSSSPAPRRRHLVCVRPATSSTRAGGTATHRLLVAGSSSSTPCLCAPSDEIYSRGRHSNSPAPRRRLLVVGSSSSAPRLCAPSGEIYSRRQH